MSVAAARPHTDAAVAAIVSLAASLSSPVLVGRGTRPVGAGWQGDPGNSAYRPYVVVYPFPGRPDGDLADPSRYLDYSAQATCVAASQDAAEAVVDLVKAAWLDKPLSVTGRSSYRGQLLADQAATRDDDVAPPVHYSIIQVTWRTQAE